MQRLKQNNSGAVLPLNPNELLSASTTQSLPGGAWCHVRMRLAIDGAAERSVHLYDGPDHSAFHHERVLVAPAVVPDVVAAVRAAFAEREPTSVDEDDSQALYRSIAFRDGDGPPRGLAVEYRDGSPVGPAASFEAAWRLLARQFPSTHVGKRSVPELDW